MPTIEQTLTERGSRYGAFDTHSAITQRLKWVMQTTEKWPHLAPDQREALEMIQHKVGRILNGDPDYADSWIDIAGYAQLVVRRLEQPRTGDIVEVDDCRKAVFRQPLEDMSNDELLRKLRTGERSGGLSPRGTHVHDWVANLAPEHPSRGAKLP